MNLSPALDCYTREQLSARDAQRMAEFIAFGPIVFQVSRLMLKLGILQLLRDSDTGLTIDEIAAAKGMTHYAVQVLVEASLTIGTVLVDKDSNRFRLAKTGWFLINDPATRVNIDFPAMPVRAGWPLTTSTATAHLTRHSTSCLSASPRRCATWGATPGGGQCAA